MPTRPPGTPDVDLTFDGATGSINGGVFMTGQFQLVPDQFFSFLEIRHNGTEQGYNTNGNLQFDERDVQNATHSILLANVPIVIGDGSHGTVEGVAYREFRLNIGEAGNAKQYLSLDSLQIWQEESGSLTNFTPGSGFAGSHTNFLAYDLDAGGDHWVGLQEGANGNGANQTEFTILIPDSYFINDPSHRYLTLYSKFGMEAGWEADSSSEIWGLGVNSTGPTPAMTVHKTATVPGGTANHAGEVISYAITVANVGDVNLTGITVTDPSVSNLNPVLSSGFNVGDTNHDNQLSAGETWQYTASHTVTQAEINTLDEINNTVTADSAQTTPVTATSSVEVEQDAQVELTKSAPVGFSVDAAGDVITYTLTVENIGSITLTNPIVSDPLLFSATPVTGDPVINPNWQIFLPILDGDYNLGDTDNDGIEEITDHNGVQDPGETFQYVYAGDIDHNGRHDPGETWVARNLGDTNNNGVKNVGETFVGDTNNNGIEDNFEQWQFKNLGDVNHNNIQDNGETWQYLNAGDSNENGVQDPGETFAYYNAGDTNNNGNPDPGETFQYYNAGDTNHNGEEDSGETFQFTFNSTVTGVDTNHDGFNDGDANANGVLDLGETWQFSGTYTATQADIDNRDVNGVPTVTPGLTHNNTATVDTDQSASDTASTSVPIVQAPSIDVSKTADVASVDAAGDVINYTITVDNTGNMTLTSVTVADPLITDVAYASGDTNNDGELDLNETWTYTRSYTVTQDDIDNGGVVDPLLAKNNTATGDTAQTGPDTASASVHIVQNPDLTITKTADVGSVDAVGDVINYTVNVANAGNMTLTGVTVTDSLTTLTLASGDTDNDGKLDLGETWTYSGSYTVQQSDIDNGGVVNPALTLTNTASADTAQTAPETASASVSVVQTPDLTITKTADVASVAAAGDVINYTVVVDNAGNMTLTGVTVTDTLTTLTLASGDTNNDGKLDVTETWTYTGSYTAQAADFDGSIDNTATVDTAQTAPESASASVTAPVPLTVGVSIDDINNLSQLSDPGGDGPSVGDPIQFFFQITNLGNTTLTSMAVSDTLGDAVPGSLQTPVPTTLAGNATFGDTFNHFLTAADIAAGHVVDDITVTALDYLSAVQTATWHYDFDLFP
jgi:uncharacterized repeat protein (TIGR01451 family)